MNRSWRLLYQGGVKAIVMGNKRHFPKKEYEGVKILSPAEFLEAVKEKI
jgi:hypothetical protein